MDTSIITSKNNRQMFEVSWTNLRYTIENSLISKWIHHRSSKEIFKGVNGYLRSGQLTALMGPSGAGKSTLLECISGIRTKGVSGNIRISGCHSITVGFVEQMDHLLDHLTVKETIIFSSMLRNYSKQKSEHSIIAENLIEKLGLESCANTYAINCSGGQRKRLSIAQELAAKANILILDEPTSGLDSTSSKQTIDAMLGLTQLEEPMALIATIHQPNSTLFNMFHHVYVISHNGECIYQGPPLDMIAALSRVGLNCPKYYNPADYIIDVSVGEFGPQSITLLSYYVKASAEESDNTQGKDMLKMISETQSKVKRPLFTHFLVLMWRFSLTTIRDPKSFIVRVGAIIPNALLIVALFPSDIGSAGGCPPSRMTLHSYEPSELMKKFQNERSLIQQNLSLCFMILMSAVFTSLTPTLMTFPAEMSVLRKEYNNNYYGILPFYLAKSIVDFPFALIPSILFTLITYYQTGQINDNPWRVLTVIAINILLSLVGQSHGMLVGALFIGNADAASYIGSMTQMPIILFSGFFKMSRLPFYLTPFSWISYMKYSFNAIVMVLYGMGRCQYEHGLTEATLNNTHYVKNPKWLDTLSLIFEQISGDSTANSEDTVMTMFGGKSAAVGDDSVTSSILTQFDLKDNKYQLWENIDTLILFSIILRIVTYFILLYKVRR